MADEDSNSLWCDLCEIFVNPDLIEAHRTGTMHQLKVSTEQEADGIDSHHAISFSDVFLHTVPGIAGLRERFSVPRPSDGHPRVLQCQPLLCERCYWVMAWAFIMIAWLLLPLTEPGELQKGPFEVHPHALQR